MSKKKVLVVALGYPNKENPFECTFFKEQIDFISSEYECTVLVIKERSKGYLLSAPITYGEELEYTKGIKQYYPIVSVSKLRKLIEYVGSLKRKKTHAQDTVGIYRSEYYREYRKKAATKIINDLNLDYDIVYCISAQSTAFDALNFAQIKNKPLFISEHRPFPHPGWSTIDVEKEAFEKAEAFLAISKDKIRQIMLQNIKPKKIEYTGNLIDEEKFVYKPVDHEFKTLLIVAACSYFKNYDMFIETMEKLSEKTESKYRVVIAGYGANKGYVKNVDEFENKIKKSKFSDKVELIPSISRDDIVSLYNRCDAFVMTSIQEGQPMVALEAACCGLPIFTTRCGGVEDYVTDEVGRITDITDSDKLSDYLKEFVEDDISFNGEVIRNRVVSMYGREAFMNNIKRTFG